MKAREMKAAAIALCFQVVNHVVVVGSLERGVRGLANCLAGSLDYGVILR
jgi:hypothetical protein